MEKSFLGLKKLTNYFLISLLFIMVALTFLDVLGRQLLNMPIYGAHDLTEHLMATIIFCGLPLLTAQRGHLTVDLLNLSFFKKYMPWWFTLVDLLICAVLAMISYEYGVAITDSIEIKEVSGELFIPRSIMYVMIAFSTGIASLLSLSNSFRKFDFEIE